METININKASAADLQKITGIGPVRATKMIEHRKNKAFRDIYEVSNVAGLGKKRMDKIIQQDILIEIK